MGCEEVVAPRRAGVGSDHFVVTSYTSRCRPWLALFDFWTTTAAARSCRAPPRSVCNERLVDYLRP